MLLVNKYGRLVSAIPGTEAYDYAIASGCRIATETDCATVQGVEVELVGIGIEPPERDSSPIVVVGKGPSSSLADLSIEYMKYQKIGINRPEYDYCLALDEIYWNRYHPKDATCTKIAHTQYYSIDGSHIQLRLPVHGGKQKLRLEVEQARANCYFSGIVGMLAALKMTTGPVLLAGFDLSGVDAAGSFYKGRQETPWKIVLKTVPKRVCYLEGMEGPLTDLIPMWVDKSLQKERHPFLADRSRKDDWIALAGGDTSNWYQKYAPGMSIATTSRGSYRVGNPDIFWLSDPNAAVLYKEEKILAEKAGSDIYPHDWSYCSKGDTYHGRSSGIMMLRAILEKNPASITLVGYNGWEGDKGKELNQLMAQTIAKIMLVNPQVEWIWEEEGPLPALVKEIYAYNIKQK